MGSAQTAFDTKTFCTHRDIANRASEQVAMTHRPVIHIGDFLRTRPPSSKARCKIYDAPWPNGTYKVTLEPNELIGPVLSVVSSEAFETIQIKDGWINIWAWNRGGQQFAFVEKQN